ncbi:MAG: hypothetical protein NC084_13230, partial [Bacteroides sp.]|nr:hypothetical protein [Eubacterium sp.]MCM1419153.1 hypothetical protein [Roseburia sp.]MCM1463659.1 hypothetical protein [Bacteroides sp.]
TKISACTGIRSSRRERRKFIVSGQAGFRPFFPKCNFVKLRQKKVALFDQSDFFLPQSFKIVIFIKRDEISAL